MKIEIMYVKNKKKINKEKLTKDVLTHFYKHKKLYVTAYLIALNTAIPGTALAASKAAGGIRLIKLMQAASFWIGLGVSIWGIVEAQLDYPGWKGRVLKGVLGYIAILLLPLIFIELRDSLQVDVWNQLGGE